MMKMKMKMKMMMIMVLACALAWSGGAVEDDSCLGSISQYCNADDGVVTDLDVSRCCIALKVAIDKERACFCEMKPYLTDPTSKANIASLFLTCGIPGTFDTLCTSTPTPDSTSSSTTPTSSGDVSENQVPSTSTSTSTPSGKKNGGSRMTRPSIWSMLIVSISLLIARGI